MKSVLPNTDDILNRSISGFHVYRLDAPVSVCYVSESLCRMTGFTPDELCSDKGRRKNTKDLYASRVHPADQTKYESFISEAAAGEGTHTCEYRLIKKDGGILWVRDTMISQSTDDGSMQGFSTLTDVSDLGSRLEDLVFLTEMIPCGFLKYTCEKQPKVTFVNQNMLDLLRFPENQPGEVDYLELYKSNIYLMIPMEERRRFSQYLNRVYTSEVPLAGEMTLLCCDGTRVHIFGWVTKSVNEKGEEEFQSVCMDITERHKAKKDAAASRYLQALTDVYDKIFEFNLDENAVKCLYCSETSMFNRFKDLSMKIDEACEKWISSAAATGERDRIRSFFFFFCHRTLPPNESEPPQITYRAMSSDGQMHTYNGIFIKVDDSVSYYCCREVPDAENAAELRSENDQLKENMKELVERFTDGVAAFEITPDEKILPLYSSDNVCDFFGYTHAEWDKLMHQPTPIGRFISYSDVTYEDFISLLEKGEADFSYYDYRSKKARRIRAVCSRRDAEGVSPFYVMLYSIKAGTDDTVKKPQEKRTVSIRTFGFFDVFVGDKAINFRSKKAKELLALLVDRRGGYITSEEAIGYLWENEPSTPVTQARYRKAALRLKNTLEEYGIADIVESVDGKRRLIPEKVTCDLYDYLTGKEEYAQLFRGSYLSNYSWSETTLGELSGNLS